MQTKTNNNALEQMLFSSICFVVLILCSIGFLVNLLLTGTFVTTSTTFVSVVIISVLYFFSKKVSLEIGTLILILMGAVVINVFWFQTEGVNGVSPLLFVIYTVAITMIIPANRYIYFISFISINIAALIAIQVYFPEYVNTYQPVQTKEWDIIATIFTTILATTLAILFFKKTHLKNQAAIAEQNKALLAAQEELLCSKEKVEAANNIKSTFLAVMNHEIRTPLNAIIGISHLLNQYNYDTPQKTELIAALNHSSQQLLSLLNEVLDFNKIESGEMKLQLQEVELSKIIEKLRLELSEAAQAKQNDLTFNVASDVPAFVMLDFYKLHKILKNLISNAIEFTAKGAVTVNVRAKQNTPNHTTLTFEVKDTGVGIQTNQQDYIFKQFAQIPNSENQSSNGIGLGLAIVTGLLDLMNSEIHVESSPELGSKFYFTLECAVVSPPKIILNQTPFSEKEQKVLLVEDNKTNILVLSHFLKKWGIAFEVANNGLEALAFYKNQPFKLILMDMQMPEMDGFEATQEIRKSNTKIPIIALTASATTEEQKRAELAGVNDYITKPFDPQHLHGVIQKYMLF